MLYEVITHRRPVQFQTGQHFLVADTATRVLVDLVDELPDVAAAITDHVTGDLV